MTTESHLSEMQLPDGLVGFLVTTEQLRDLARRLRDVAAYAAFLEQRERSDTLWRTALDLVSLADEEDALEFADDE
jgi:hypothetical protein